MSFMFKPLTYDDTKAINHLECTVDVVEKYSSIVSKILNDINGPMVILIDGYISAPFKEIINEFEIQSRAYGVSFNSFNMEMLYKSEEKINELTKDNLPLNYEDDPVLLFGKVYEGDIQDFIDDQKLQAVLSTIKESDNQLIILFGHGSTIMEFKRIADKIIYIDVTPKTTAVRAREKRFINIGDKQARSFNLLMRRNYYVDFEIALKTRKELLKNNLIDYYILSNYDKEPQMITGEALSTVLKELVQYPFRAKPVYLEGIWGGEYIRKIRDIPKDISNNIAWIFEFIPMEVSIVVETNHKYLDIPFYTFVQNNGLEMMGEKIYHDFDGYFPIRFNYDDTWHSDGNMSIQVHPDEDFIIENYNEFGRQDEAYYVIATGHGARTYAGWKGDGREFIKLAKQAEKEKSEIDYQEYVNSVPSIPGKQIMIPAGTIHASGQNQFILELGSLTLGSYTYKMYDYNRKDKDGNLRPIHLKNAEKVLRFDRDSEWVNENIAIEPKLIDDNEEYKEFIVGYTELMYFQTNRVEIKTKGKYSQKKDGFLVLTLVDGESADVYSKNDPDKVYHMNYLDIVTVPSTIDEYVIQATGYQPIVVHKTFIREGAKRFKNPKYLK
ncbi:class I mannose-6-phosphate isomerase [Faecalicoccus acidiformans]|uniref:class I mannose-6-phosphate isomerase n=1 Tax=Faecalicoccus acidiformans TaxID=915173 RepID=UPI0025A3A19E|nr:class I mannose-6-phosphate isomerase [Faecalicoccus acidiformans]MDM8203653.1 class I mannose-6-phosphate isomerase [Faecalicoccus acidiformans]